MSAPRLTIPVTLAAALILAISLPALGPGCGPAAPEFDKAAQYTPESLAQELVLRYRALSPESKKSTRRPVRRSKGSKSAADLQRDEAATKKNQGAPTTKKRTGPPTLDDLMDDVGYKLDMIKATPRAESYQKVIDAISKDSSLTEPDKKLLSEKLKELGEVP